MGRNPEAGNQGAPLEPDEWGQVTDKHPEELLLHVTHDIEIVTYGSGQEGDKPRAVAIECITCQTVLLDWERNM